MGHRFLSFLFISILSIAAFSGEDGEGVLLKNLRRYQGVAEDHKDVRVNIRFGHFDRSLTDPATDIVTENDETNLLRVNVKLVDRVEFQYGQGTEVFRVRKVGETAPRERLENLSQRLSIGKSQKRGPLKLKERLTLIDRHGIDNHYRNDETFVAGAVSADYEIRWEKDASAYGVDVETGYERDRGFRPELGRGLRELDTYQGRVTIYAPRWFIESLYENQYVDDEADYYYTQNTAALYWRADSSDYGTFAAGVQHRRTNLNFREVLGIVLMASMRDNSWLPGRNATEDGKEVVSPVGVDFIFFMDPTGGSEGGNNADTWEMTMRLTGYGWGVDTFVGDMVGKDGETFRAGGQWYFWMDF